MFFSLICLTATLVPLTVLEISLLLSKLQKVQNSTVSLVALSLKLLKLIKYLLIVVSLHWLPNESRTHKLSSFLLCSNCLNPVNVLDLIWKCLGYSQLWPLQPACSQIWAWAGSEIRQIRFPTCIQSVSILPKKDQIILCKHSPDLIWMAWLGFSRHLWSRRKLVCKNHWAWFWQNATSPLPVSYFQDQMAWSYYVKPAWIIPFGSGWLCQVLAKRIRSRSKPM